MTTEPLETMGETRSIWELPQGSGLEKLEVVFKQIWAHNISNMVAERRLTAMKLLEEGAVELIGLASLPNTTQNQEREVANGAKALTEADRDLH